MTGSKQDVLDDFAVDWKGKATLERYLRDYPQFAEELIDLAFELDRPETPASEKPLSAEDQAVIDEAWQRYSERHRAGEI